jgi:hypothetical protein
MAGLRVVSIFMYVYLNILIVNESCEIYSYILKHPILVSVFGKYSTKLKSTFNGPYIFILRDISDPKLMFHPVHERGGVK